MNRRHFLRNSMYSSLLLGASGVPFINSANAAFESLTNRILVNLYMDGGPDMRHLIVPEMPSVLNTTTRATAAYKYWENRYLIHGLGNSETQWQQRWNNDYIPFTINDGSVNDGVTFGIWRGAGWLIRMYEEGNAAFVANTAIGRNRAHDRSEIQLLQGNVSSTETDTERSGWGGRLARVANQNAISLTDRPNPFCFGPVDDPVYDANRIDNRNFISISNSRQIGLFEANLEANQTYNTDDKMARALKSYYSALRVEQQAGGLSEAYDKFMDHEAKVRFFGDELNRLLDFDVPPLINALYDRVDGINVGSGDNRPRRVLRSGSFGRQIRNLYDSIAANRVLGLRVAALRYGGWDSHRQQGDRSNNQDFYNPNVNNRGIEQGFRDIFGGPNTHDNSALHSGFSALWENLNNADKDRIVITVAGEFGRQIRQNRDAGTDHGDGNIVMVIGNGVRGGVYGDLFPDSDIDGYDDTRRYATPDIESLTEMEHVFGSVCNWVVSGSANTVFPRLALSSGNEQYPDLEAGVSLGSNLFET